MEWSVHVDGGGETDVGAGEVEGVDDLPGRRRRGHTVMDGTPPTGVLSVDQVVGGRRVGALGR
jgi:hypothetical protein